MVAETATSWQDAASLYDAGVFQAVDIDGNLVDFGKDLKGRVLLISNLASG